MPKSNLQKVFQTTKLANAILKKAGGMMLKTSFNTAKQIATLYKDAGVQAFNLSKEVVKKTVVLTINNQKELIKTSGTAIKEMAQGMQESEAKVKVAPNGRPPKSGKKTKQPRKKKELTIDDLLETPEV